MFRPYIPYKSGLGHATRGSDAPGAAQTSIGSGPAGGDGTWGLRFRV